MANKATNGSLFILVGAGVSIPSPTNAPDSAQLAFTTKAALMATELEGIPGPVPDSDLLALADAVETQGATAAALLRSTILHQFDFKTATPNYAHEASRDL